jgi:hypothetical protein
MAVRAALLALALLAAAPALADDASDLRQKNQTVMAATPRAPGVFALEDDATIKHLQSGLVCPARFPNVVLFHLFVYAADGSDVGCDYGRADGRGGAWSKLTIFVVKAKPDATVEDAFARYRGEVLLTYPEARSQGPSVQVEDKSKGASPLPDFRSEDFLIAENDQTYTTQLYVTVVKSWTIEIRVSFVGTPNAIDASREGTSSVVDETGDRLMGFNALIRTVGTVNP